MRIEHPSTRTRYFTREQDSNYLLYEFPAIRYENQKLNGKPQNIAKKIVRTCPGSCLDSKLTPLIHSPILSSIHPSIHHLYLFYPSIEATSSMFRAWEDINKLLNYLSTELNMVVEMKKYGRNIVKFKSSWFISYLPLLNSPFKKNACNFSPNIIWKDF